MRMGPVPLGKSAFKGNNPGQTEPRRDQAENIGETLDPTLPEAFRSTNQRILFLEESNATMPCSESS
jgi:hypothetical protein